jgi:hypothetical protein
MDSYEFTPDELRILRAALASYVGDFGHDEADVLRPAKALLTRIGGYPQRVGDTSPDEVPGALAH